MVVEESCFMYRTTLEPVFDCQMPHVKHRRRNTIVLTKAVPMFSLVALPQCTHMHGQYHYQNLTESHAAGAAPQDNV